MSTFTLAISSLTTSNLPWFMDLTFQVSVKYCSLQHQTLLPSSVTSTTRCCFCFGSVSSFFLEILLHPSPIVFWASANQGIHLSVCHSEERWAPVWTFWGMESPCESLWINCLSLHPSTVRRMVESYKIVGLMLFPGQITLLRGIWYV